MTYSDVNKDRDGEDSSSISTRLLIQIKAGDPSGWRRFVKKFEGLMLRWCRRSGLSTEDSEDTCQNALTRVACGIGDFRRGGIVGSFRGWLHAITRNSVRDHLRKKRRCVQTVGGRPPDQAMQARPNRVIAADESSSSNSSSGEKRSTEWYERQRQVLAYVRSQVKPRTWEVMCRLSESGMQARQVAEEFGMTLGAVLSVRSRCLRLARDAIAYPSLVSRVLVTPQVDRIDPDSIREVKQ